MIVGVTVTTVTTTDAVTMIVVVMCCCCTVCFLSFAPTPADPRTTAVSLSRPSVNDGSVNGC